MFFDHFVAADVRRRTVESLAPDGKGQQVWRELEVDSDDLKVIKTATAP